jgi:hypothetical protein
MHNIYKKSFVYQLQCSSSLSLFSIQSIITITINYNYHCYHCLHCTWITSYLTHCHYLFHLAQGFPLTASALTILTRLNSSMSLIIVAKTTGSLSLVALRSHKLRNSHNKHNCCTFTVVLLSPFWSTIATIFSVILHNSMIVAKCRNLLSVSTLFPHNTRKVSLKSRLHSFPWH